MIYPQPQTSLKKDLSNIQQIGIQNPHHLRLAIFSERPFRYRYTYKRTTKNTGNTKERDSGSCSSESEYVLNPPLPHSLYLSTLTFPPSFNFPPYQQATLTPLPLETLLILSPFPTSLLHPSINLPTYLLSLLSPSTSLFLIHHLDIPLPYPRPHTPQNTPTPAPSQTPYAPHPLTLLRYIATTILTLSSLPQTLAIQAARNLAKAEPNFGLEEASEGIIIGKGANAFSTQVGRGGIIIEMEHRRKSGRSVTETFYLPSSPPTPTSTPSSSSFSSQSDTIKNILILSDHPLFAPPTPTTALPSGEESVKEEDLGGTFNLGLTEKQRRDREGVVLPYYDAQRRGGEGVGSGEGGRILYEMGVEDDFDEEEDEI